VDLSWLYFAIIFPLLSGMILRDGYPMHIIPALLRDALLGGFGIM
jgi:hypothetical protein